MALGDANAIADVTQTLVNLLTGLDVTLDSPAALQAGAADATWAKINLYLYQVLENPHSKNQPWVTRDDGKAEYPPLALNLYYLLTPYASDTPSAHTVLSHAMQTFYDHSILADADLVEPLRLSVDHLSLTLVPLKLEDLTRIWNALQTPYRLSVAYEARIALIRSQQADEAGRVLTRTNEYAQIA